MQETHKECGSERAAPLLVRGNMAGDYGMSRLVRTDFLCLCVDA